MVSGLVGIVVLVLLDFSPSLIWTLIIFIILRTLILFPPINLNFPNKLEKLPRIDSDFLNKLEKLPWINSY